MTITTPSIKNMSPQLLVTDLDNAIRYYTSQLGFELDFRYQDFYAGIKRDGFTVHLKAGRPNVAERKNKRENYDLDIVFSVTAVEELYNDFSNKSVEIIQPLCERPYGREFYVSDPDGNTLAFLESD